MADCVEAGNEHSVEDVDEDGVEDGGKEGCQEDNFDSVQ